MARKHSEEIVTRVIRQRQKNGDIYVIERQTRYDPEKKYNVVLSSKIIGKIRWFQPARNAQAEKKSQIYRLLC